MVILISHRNAKIILTILQNILFQYDVDSLEHSVICETIGSINRSIHIYNSDKQ